MSNKSSEILLQNDPFDSNPSFYHGLEWKVDKRTNNDCTRSSFFRPQHEVCMKSNLPGAKFMKFEIEPRSAGHPRKANLLKFDTEQAPSDVKAPYIQICKGDSGGGPQCHCIGCSYFNNIWNDN